MIPGDKEPATWNSMYKTRCVELVREIRVFYKIENRRSRDRKFSRVEVNILYVHEHTVIIYGPISHPIAHHMMKIQFVDILQHN